MQGLAVRQPMAELSPTRPFPIDTERYSLCNDTTVLIFRYYFHSYITRARVCVCMYVCVCYNVTIKSIHSRDEYLSRYVKYSLIKKQCVITISMHESLKHPWRVIKKEIYPSARQESSSTMNTPTFQTRVAHVKSRKYHVRWIIGARILLTRVVANDVCSKTLIHLSLCVQRRRSQTRVVCVASYFDKAYCHDISFVSIFYEIYVREQGHLKYPSYFNDCS